jgi:phage terminase large subunit GpA-like protein
LPPPRWTIPPLRTAAELIRGQAHLVCPQEAQTVSQWAADNQAFDAEILPWQAEIMDRLGDPDVGEVGMMGPSQAGKSTIGLAWLGHAIDQDPADFLIAQPSQNLSQTFVVTRVEPMIEATAAVKRKLSPAANANNIFLKQFRGMFLATVWPVAAQFTQRPIRFGWLDDYDQFPDDIDGQGSGIALLDGRQTSFEGRDRKLISSSPARDDGSGIEAFVASGTDERLQPVCPHCEERIELDLLRDLHFTGKPVDGKPAGRGTADEAEASAHVVCPANGCVLEPSDRRRLLDSLAGLPARGFVAANGSAPRRRSTFRIDGLLALTTWPKLARLWREALIAWETRQDETGLRTFVNTKAGVNYRAKASGEKPLDADALKLRREKGFFLGTVPYGVKVLVTLVDVQANRVEFATVGYGEGLESWLIDRGSIEVLDDGLTQLAPFTHPEHSAVLLPLFNKRYPLADGVRSAEQLRRDKDWPTAPVLTVALDVGGGGDKEKGATEFAKAFWNAARALGIPPARITLVKGGNRPTGDLMPRAKFADQKRKGGAKRSSAQLWLPNVHAIKNTIDARLRRLDPGPGFIHLPGGKIGGRALRPGENEAGTGRLLDSHVEEIAAEELQKGKWIKRQTRNETWDLLVYGYAAILRPPFAQSRTHMRWVPPAFRVPDHPAPALPLAEAEAAAAAAAPASPPVPPKPAAAAAPARPAAAAPRPAVKSNWIAPRRGKNWLKPRR